MAMELSDEQRQAVDTAGTPLKLVDPRNGHVYVLVQEQVFSQVQLLLSDDLADTYPAQIESAMRAGWNDPVMDEYNDYDRRRSP